jgi:two-component system, NtrC family, sensor kinase
MHKNELETVRRILEGLPFPFNIIDSQTYQLIREGSEDSESKNPTCYNLTHHRDIPCNSKEHTCPLQEVLKTKSPALSRHIHYDNNNQEQIIDVYGIPLFDEKENISHMIEFCVDVSEMAKIQNERKTLKHQLIDAHKMEQIGTLTAGILHEINTPIQFIGDNLSFLQEHLDLLNHMNETIIRDLPYLKEEIPNAIEQSISGINHILSVITAMKSFAHKNNTNEYSLININKTIDNIIIISKNEWKYYAEIRKEYDKKLPLIHCNASGIRQVILNLIVNAAQAISEQEGERPPGIITLRTYQTNQNLQIEVKDNGPGIPTSILKNIFKPYFTTKKIGVGSGQGLAIAKSIIEGHQGTISVDSTPDKGTCFTLSLPILEEEGDPDDL